MRQLEAHEMCRYPCFWSTPNRDFQQTKKLAFQRTEEAIEMIKHHPFSPELRRWTPVINDPAWTLDKYVEEAQELPVIRITDRHDTRQKDVGNARSCGVGLAVPCHLGACRGLEELVDIAGLRASQAAGVGVCSVNARRADGDSHCERGARAIGPEERVERGG